MGSPTYSAKLAMRLLGEYGLVACVPTSIAHPAAAETEGSVAHDPRVADAVHAWKEWIEYQAAINRAPCLSVGVVHDQELVAADAFGLADPAAGGGGGNRTLPPPFRETAAMRDFRGQTEWGQRVGI